MPVPLTSISAGRSISGLSVKSRPTPMDLVMPAPSSIGGLNGANPQVDVSGEARSPLRPACRIMRPFPDTGQRRTVRVTASSLSVTGVGNNNPSPLPPAPARRSIPPANGQRRQHFPHGGRANRRRKWRYSITNGGQISASSYNNGEGGTVAVNQNNSADGITIDGVGRRLRPGFSRRNLGWKFIRS